MASINFSTINNLDREEISKQRNSKHGSYLTLVLKNFDFNMLGTFTAFFHVEAGTKFSPVWSQLMSYAGIFSASTVSITSRRNSCFKVATSATVNFGFLVPFLWVNFIFLNKDLAHVLLSSAGPPYSTSLDL